MAARLIVIDTDVLVSTAGHPDKTFAIWEAAVRTDRVVPVTTESALREPQEVAGRPKVRAAIPQLQSNLPLFVAAYQRMCDFRTSQGKN